ncbi:RING-H2 finger protein ATL74-like [Rhodamnia argentea]|uniref:RING-type E3 ubiquitin transferase n=1 Tax=Rhodamnia argentea TaxID=178133 RepID=A0A8B8N5M7_9MYRT|nr:RING-H2 finger protein ATL74-like [Rhodamnia argentea]
MVTVLIILLFVGIVIVVLFHVCIVEWGFRMSGLSRAGQAANRALADRASAGSTSMSVGDVEKLPCFNFEAGHYDEDQEGTITMAVATSPVSCVVCLEEFKIGDKCRLLPICRHSFHAGCIDAWLLKVASCPICRSRADSGWSLAEGSSSSGCGPSGSSRFEDDVSTGVAESQMNSSDISRSESRERGDLIGALRVETEDLPNNTPA